MHNAKSSCNNITTCVDYRRYAVLTGPGFGCRNVYETAEATTQYILSTTHQYDKERTCMSLS